MWPYNQETKAKFAQKNMKKKGYTEGIDQIENTPEIAAVEEDVSLPVTPQVAKKVVEKAVVEKVETPKTGKRKAAEMETTPATRYTDCNSNLIITIILVELLRASHSLNLVNVF